MTDAAHPERGPDARRRPRRGALTVVGVGSAGLGAYASTVVDPAYLQGVAGVLPILVGSAALLGVVLLVALCVAASRRIGADVVLHELLSWSLALLGRERPWVFTPAVREVEPAPPPDDPQGRRE